MIGINVKSILDLKKILGGSDLELSVPEKATINDLLELLKNRFGNKIESQLFEPDSTVPFSYILFMVNGRDIRFLDHFETVLNDGDDVLILPPVGGG